MAPPHSHSHSPRSREQTPVIYLSTEERLRRAHHRVRKARALVETRECRVEDLCEASRPGTDISEAQEGVEQARIALKARQDELKELEAEYPAAAAGPPVAPVTQSIQLNNCTITGGTISSVAQSPPPPVPHQENAPVAAAEGTNNDPEAPS